MNKPTRDAAGEAGQASAPARFAAEAFLEGLKAYGVDYLFATPGTDFPSIVEAFAREAVRLEGEPAGTPSTLPTPVPVTHENLAVCMAHGYFLATGRAQAAMVHVSVGTMNTLCALANAARDNIPILLAAGRNPLTENGVFGCRNRQIHWAQEMFDQGGMLRELVKWDYELRHPNQAADAARRAVEIATADPQGPIYLALPRETLAGPAPDGRPPAMPVSPPPAPAPEAIATLARWIAEARSPLIVTGAVGRDPAAVPLLAELAERYAVGVVSMVGRYVNLGDDHPCLLGYESGPFVGEADLIVAIDCDVPWFPSVTPANPEARVVQVEVDPHFSAYPMRSFPCDLAVTGRGRPVLAALLEALPAVADPEAPAIAARRVALARRSADRRAQTAARAEKAGGGGQITFEWAARCVQTLIDAETVLFSEYPLHQSMMGTLAPGRYFGLSPAGGLGWGLGAALGYKLARRDCTVIAALGDGAYVFNNPTACHWMAQAQDLPVLTLVFNNGIWNAVRRSTLSMYGQGAAAANDGLLLSDLSPSPDFEKIVTAHGGLGLRADTPAALPEVLAEALAAVKGGRQALVNIVAPHVPQP